MTPTIDELVLVAERVMGWRRVSGDEFCRYPGGAEKGTFCVTVKQTVAPADLDTGEWYPPNSDSDMAGLLRKLAECVRLRLTFDGVLWFMEIGRTEYMKPELRDAVWLAALAVAKEKTKATK